jgi:hypothetical protein
LDRLWNSIPVGTGQNSVFRRILKSYVRKYCLIVDEDRDPKRPADRESPEQASPGFDDVQKRRILQQKNTQDSKHQKKRIEHLPERVACDCPLNLLIFNFFHHRDI